MWKSFLHNWETGARVGELTGLQGRRLFFGLNTNNTFSATLPMKGPLVDVLLESDFHLVSAYRLNPDTGSYDLKFVGPIQTIEEVVEGDIPSIGFNAVGPYWHLERRFLDNEDGDGKTVTGWNPSMAISRGRLLRKFVNKTNEIDGNSWIRADIDDQETTSGEINLGAQGGYKRLSDVFVEQSATLDGVDWEIEPVIDTDSDGLILGNLKTYNPAGTNRSTGVNAVIFEYGLGQHNATRIYRQRSLEGLANRVASVFEGSGTYSISTQDAASIGDIGVWEDLIQSDNIKDNHREKLVGLHVAMRKGARQLIEINAARSDSGNQYVPMHHYKPGDVIGARAYYGDKLRINGALRVYDITIDIADDGAETANLGVYLS